MTVFATRVYFCFFKLTYRKFHCLYIVEIAKVKGMQAAKRSVEEIEICVGSNLQIETTIERRLASTIRSEREY